MAKLLRFVFLFIAALSAILFFSLYQFRGDLYEWTEVEPATMAELYPVAGDAAAIIGIIPVVPGKVEVKLKNLDGCRGWKVSSSRGGVQREGGDQPVVSLRSGVDNYILEPLDCKIQKPQIDAIRLNIYFGTADTVAHLGISRDQIQLNEANLPWLKTSPVDFNKWTPRKNAYKNEDNQAALIALKEAGLDFEASTEEKIRFLVRFILERMPSGAPPAYLYQLSPWAVLQEAESKDVRYYCFQWSLVYAYLANLVGIPTRNLFTGGADRHIDLGSHAFSESYISEEARWVFVDPASRIVFVETPNGNRLSGAEVYSAIVSRNTSSLVAHVLSGGIIEPRSFDEVSGGINTFIHRENFLIYVGSLDSRYQFTDTGIAKAFRQLRRFLFQPQQYLGYTHFVSYHWLRRLSFFSTFFFGCGAVLLFVIGRKR